MKYSHLQNKKNNDFHYLIFLLIISFIFICFEPGIFFIFAFIIEIPIIKLYYENQKEKRNKLEEELKKKNDEEEKRRKQKKKKKN